MSAHYAAGHGGATPEYQDALDAEQSALADAFAAWDRFVNAQATVTALRASGDDLRSTAA